MEGKYKDKYYHGMIDISNINNVSELKAILEVTRHIDEGNERKYQHLRKIPKIIEFDRMLKEKYHSRFNSDTYEDKEIQSYYDVIAEINMCVRIAVNVNDKLHKILFGNHLKIWSGSKSDFAREVNDMYKLHENDYKSLREATKELYMEYDWTGWDWEFNRCYDLVKKT